MCACFFLYASCCCYSWSTLSLHSWYGHLSSFKWSQGFQEIWQYDNHAYIHAHPHTLKHAYTHACAHTCLAFSQQGTHVNMHHMPTRFTLKFCSLQRTQFVCFWWSWLLAWSTWQWNIINTKKNKTYNFIYKVPGTASSNMLKTKQCWSSEPVTIVLPSLYEYKKEWASCQITWKSE